MARIAIERTGDAAYRVTIDDEAGRTAHEVVATAAHVDRYAPGAPPERLIEASFRFLLEREPKEAILSRFEIPVIERYFPEYPREIRRALQADVERPESNTGRAQA